jgi:hypothetical protein
MRTKNNENCNNSSQFITFVRFWNSRSPACQLCPILGLGLFRKMPSGSGKQRAPYLMVRGKVPGAALQYSAQNILRFRDRFWTTLPPVQLRADIERPANQNDNEITK